MFSTKNLVLKATIRWKSKVAEHVENYYIPKANLWRDIFPRDVGEALKWANIGDKISFSLPKGSLIPAVKESNIKNISRCSFSPSFAHKIQPRRGRFYPKGFFKDITGVFPSNFEPCRIISVDEKKLLVDFNHPMAYYDIEGEIEVLDINQKDHDMGGQLHDWFEEIFNYGPGMQTRYDDIPTDFFEVDAFKREDEEPDVKFYQNPRLVGHVDSTASKHITDFLSLVLKDEYKVLDLMSSYQSHLPPGFKMHVTGLGLNKVELENNWQLNDHVIQDLNENTTLPFENDSFDAVICNLSVEYLIKPLDVCKEVHRILRSGGYFVITFSNRWFPPKVTKLWTELHEFERMGFVLELLLNCSGFSDLKTVSYRNWPRPIDDPHYYKTHVSDPVYIVCGKAMK